MTDYTQVDHLPTHGRRVVFQGVEGAYSFGAMKEFFDDTITSFHVDTWKEAMEAITKGEADYAVLPIENSTAGIVSDIYDLLVEFPTRRHWPSAAAFSIPMKTGKQRND